MHADNNKHVLEVRADILRGERQRSRLLKDNGDDVVPYVSLSQELREEKERTYILNCAFNQRRETRNKSRITVLYAVSYYRVLLRYTPTLSLS